MAMTLRRAGARRHPVYRQCGEYATKAFRQPCERLSAVQSMRPPGSALDNAVLESWHSTLEFELWRLQHFATRAQARAAVSTAAEY
jgi:putative transposase